MNIAIDSLFLYSSPFTGISIYTKELIRQFALFDNLDVSVIYAGKSDSEREQIKKELVNCEYKLLEIPISGKLARSTWSFSDFPNITPYLKEIDIYHSPFYILPGLSNSQKVIVTIYDIFPILFPKFFPLTTRVAHLQRLNKIKRYCENDNVGIVTVSNHSKKDIVEKMGIPEEKIAVTHLGVQSIFNANPISDSKEILNKYNISYPFILSVGSINPRKNIERLLEAFTLMKKNNKLPHKLVLVGTSGWLNGKIKASIQGNKDIILIGIVPEDELPTFFQQADLFMFPSLYEGFGLPVIEAMACGAPVITSNCSSLPEIAGDAAVLVDPYNSKKISEAMLHILTNSAAKHDMIQKGIEQSKKFNWEKTAKMTLEAYKMLQI
jgi:glycosyltransferase involved in cell wall biosynthesis